MLFHQNRLDEIRDAVESGLHTFGRTYDGLQRSLFLAYVSPGVYAGLAVANNPRDQLNSDLAVLNRMACLEDGSVPLESWLRRAEDTLKSQRQARVIRSALLELDEHLRSPSVEDPVLPANELPSGLERTIHRDDSLPFSFVRGAQRVGQAVARLWVPVYAGSEPVRKDDGTPLRAFGTGWLAAPNLLMTNFHVINARRLGEPAASLEERKLQATQMEVLFDYDDDGFEGHSARVAGIEAFDVGLDYALLRLSASVVGRMPLNLSSKRIVVAGPEQYLAVNIVQHPGGRPKRVAIRNNLIHRAEYPRVQYYTDTEAGSSGSPVCDDSWEVVALHCSWQAVTGVKFQGRPTGWVNQGTQMAAVLDHLQTTSLGLFQKVLGQ